VSIDGSTLGAIIVVVFGAVWGVAGAIGLPRPWRTWGLALSIAVSAALLIWCLMPHTTSMSGTFRGGVYGAAVAFELAGITAIVWLLRRLRLPRYILPAVGFVVGLHFLGMWKATDLLVFVWTAVGMCTVSVIAVWLPDHSGGRAVDVRSVITGFGLALVLWTTGVFGLR
jgi:hypothetical protein